MMTLFEWVGGRLASAAGNAWIVEALGWTLLHFIWQGFAMAVVLAVMLTALRRQSAVARYALCCGAMLMMLAAVVGTFARLAAETLARLDDRPVVHAAADLAAAQPAPGIALASIVVVWTIGVCVLSLRLLGGWVAVQRLRSAAVAPAENLARAVQRLSRRMGIHTAVEVLESAAAAVPLTIGWLKPAILLPVGVMTGLTREQIEIVIAHELAHILRRDYLVNLLQSTLETLLFYHPAVWWVSARVREEREYCCDDLAVAVCGDAVGYVRTFAKLETLRGGRAALCPSAVGGSLMRRMTRIAGRPVPPRRRGAAWVLPLAVAPAVIGMAALPWRAIEALNAGKELAAMDSANGDAEGALADTAQPQLEFGDEAIWQLAEADVDLVPGQRVWVTAEPAGEGKHVWIAARDMNPDSLRDLHQKMAEHGVDVADLHEKLAQRFLELHPAPAEGQFNFVFRAPDGEQGESAGGTFEIALDPIQIGPESHTEEAIRAHHEALMEKFKGIHQTLMLHGLQDGGQDVRVEVKLTGEHLSVEAAPSQDVGLELVPEATVEVQHCDEALLGDVSPTGSLLDRLTPFVEPAEPPNAAPGQGELRIELKLHGEGGQIIEYPGAEGPAASIELSGAVPAQREIIILRADPAGHLREVRPLESGEVPVEAIEAMQDQYGDVIYFRGPADGIHCKAVRDGELPGPPIPWEVQVGPDDCDDEGMPAGPHVFRAVRVMKPVEASADQPAGPPLRRIPLVGGTFRVPVPAPGAELPEKQPAEQPK